MSEHVFFVLS